MNHVINHTTNHTIRFDRPAPQRRLPAYYPVRPNVMYLDRYRTTVGAAAASSA